MNRIFRSVWNEVSRTWVAAAECVKSQGKSSGGSREDGTAAVALDDKKPRRGIQRPRPALLALEARLMFDGAAVATGAEVMADAVHHGAPEAMAVEAGRLSEAPAAAPVEQASPAVETAAPPRVEIVFIESNVTDPQSLLDGLRPGAEVHVLDAARDGLAQMAQILAGRSGIDAIHVLSHGSPGAVGLGSLTLGIENLPEHSADLATIGRALNPDADILLYGCNTAAGSDGAAFVAALAQATQADVAASIDPTGAASLGGNWQLELASGVIQTDMTILGRSVDDYAHLLPVNTAPTIGGAVADQAVRDSAIVNPFAAVTITDPDGGASETVTITLDSAAKGVFTAASLTASGFSTSDGGLTYTHAAGTPAALQTAIRALVYDPTDNRVAVGSTETTTFTISVNDGIAAAVTNNTTTVVAMSVDYGQRSFGTSGSSIYFRPGDTSSTWTFSGMYDTAYYKVDFNPTGLGAEDWLLTRGKFQYSTNGGTTWSDYNDTTTIPNAGAINFVTASGRLWRYVDNSPADTTTTNNIGYGYHVVNGGGSTGTGSSIIPDLAPTDISSDKSYFLSGTSQGTAVATLTPSDTGDTTGGYWEIDSQSVPNLFTIAATNSTSNTAILSIGSGTLPAAGQTATVTARYYDRFQTNNGTATGMAGEGYSKQFTFTVVDEQSQDLNFGNDLKVSTTTANDQRSPSVTTLSNGNFVTVWQSAGQGEATNKNGIYGQIYTAAGVAVGSEFAITTAGNGVDETTPVVSALNAGRFVVAYNTTPGANGLDIAYRIIEADGTVGSQLVANTTVAGSQTMPALTTLSDGSFVAAWATSGEIHAQKFNAADGSKSGTELTIDASGNDVNPMLSSLSNGNYVVAWGDAGSYEVKAVVSSAPSTVIDVSSGSMASAYVFSTGNPQARVAGLSGGGFVVAWSTYDSNYGQTDIVFQRYDNSGAAQGSTTQANVSTAVGTYKDLASIAALSGGGFVVGWQADSGDYDLNGIFGRRFTSTGVAVDATDFEINQHRLGNQNSPVMTALASDMFATAWVDDTSDTTSAGVEARVLLLPTPGITSAAYDASTGILSVTAANLTTGDTIDPTQLTLTGEGGATYTLTTNSTTASSSTAFTITLNATDRAAVNLMMNKAGTSSTSGTTFNLAGAVNWDSTASAGADATNAVTVSNVAAPAVTSATYDAATGVLSVTGTGFLSKSGAANDIDVTKLTLTGEGGATYTLTANTSNVDVSSGTAFSVTLGSTDKAGVNLLLNRDGTSSTGATTYNLNAAEDWAVGADATVNVVDATNGVTVSNVPVPAITSATYNASTGVLTVTGTGFLQLSGATNDIDVSKLTLTGEGGTTYTLTTTSVEITSGTSFAVTLNATDKNGVNLLLNKNGTSSSGSTTYNLGAAEDWAAGAAAGVTDVDATGNGVTVSNVAVPTITSATYDASTGVMVVTGTNFLRKSGANNDIDVSKLSFKGEGSTGTTYTLTTTSVDVTSTTSFTITLNATDKDGVNFIADQNGTTSKSGTTYKLNGLEDWAAGADAALTTMDTTGNGITVSNVAVPTITSATYNASTGVLVVTGTGILLQSGVLNDIDVHQLSIVGEGGGSGYALSNTSAVDATNINGFTVTLNSTDRAAVNLLLNNAGTSSTGGTTYNLVANEDWNLGAVTATTIADLTGNGITVSGLAAPTITSATYNATTGVLAVTGTGFLSLSGATNDIDVSKLTLVGEDGQSRTLTTSNVEITSGTAFSVTLNAADQAAVNLFMNKTGTSSTSGSTYNLAAAEDWAKGAGTGVTDADLSGNDITATVAAPTVTSATYDASTGVLTVTGTNFTTLATGGSNDIDVTKLSITGDSTTYALTSGNVDVTSDTSFTITLNSADRIALATRLNKDGTSSTGNTTYNLMANEDWARGADATLTIADTTGNGITVSNYPVLSIASASYDAATGVLSLTGVNMTTGDTIDPSKLTLTGEGGTTYTLTTSSVTAASATSVLITLNATDRAALGLILNKDGTSSTSSTTYNVAAAANWDSTASAAADLTGNGVTVSNTPAPTITSATYDASTGVLVVTGTGLNQKSGATNDIDVTKLTLTGEGGATYALTANTSNVEVTSGTSFTVTLGSTDKAAVNLLMNRNGTTATDATTPFNVAGASGWNAGSNLGAADLTGNAVTVSNVAVPAITSATYDASTGVLVVSGTGFLTRSGAANDIDVSKLSIMAEGGTVTLSSSSNVDVTSGTSLTVTLSATDRQALALLTNQVGIRSTDGVKYNLAAAEDWALGADSAVTTADLPLNDITVSNIPRPTITSATWTQSTGVLVVTGTNFVTKAGTGNDIDVTKLTLSGDSTAYTLTSDTASVEITSATSFTITLGATDKAAIASRLNKAGTSSTGSQTYNLAAAEDWMAGSAGSNVNLVDADLTGNGITAGGFNVSPTLGGAVANQAVNDNATLNPFSSFTITDADVGATETVSITLDTAAKGAFTAASLTASGFSTADGGLTYTHAAGTPSAIQTAMGQLVYQPGSNRMSNGATETTTFTVSVDDGFGAVTDNTTTVVSTSVNDAPVLTTPSAASYVDTLALDTFSNSTGTLVGSDVDLGQTLTYGIAGGTVSGGVSTLAGSYGSLSVNTTSGAYTYTPSAGAINALTANTSDTFTVTVSDGTASTTATYTVNLTAANDTPTLVTPTAASYTDTAALDTFSNSTGTLAGSDVDTGQTLTYGITGGTVSGGVSTLAGSYGSLSVNTTSGAYTYTPSAGTINALTANTSDTFTVNVSDGILSTTATYTVNLVAANDTPTLVTPTAASYTDTAALDTFSNSTGTLAGSDVDTGQTLTYGIAGGTVSGGVSTLAGNHGSLSVNTTSGAYTYTPSAGAINALTANTTDTFIVNVSDGTASTTATYTVNLTAANDTPTLATPTAASYTDTAALDTFSNSTGTLAGSDVDTGQTLTYGIAGGTVSGGVSTLAGSYGSLSVNTASGAYTYTPSAGAINALTANTTDTFTVNVSDGTASTAATYTVTIHGADDIASLTPTTISLDEADAPLSTQGLLPFSDVDSASNFVPQTGTVGLYGSFSVNAAGAWQYNATAHNEFAAGTVYIDTFQVVNGDGATTSVSIHIKGTNDAAVIGGATTATTPKATGTSTSGVLTIQDIDSPAEFVAQAVTAGQFGDFFLGADGAWTYTLNKDTTRVMALKTGESLTDGFTVTSADGTTARVVVTIHGNDDIVIAPAAQPLPPEPAVAPLSAPSDFTLPSVSQPVAGTPVITERAIVEKIAFASAGPVNSTGFEARSNVVVAPSPAADSAGSASNSGFRAAVSADDSAPLSVFKGVPDQHIPLQSGPVSFSIPADAFTARFNAVLSIEVRQTDGQALPTWLKFDPNTGEFSGTVPPNAPSELVIMVTVKDTQGGEAATTFRVKLVKELQGRHGLSEQLRLAARQPHLFARTSVPRRVA